MELYIQNIILLIGLIIIYLCQIIYRIFIIIILYRYKTGKMVINHDEIEKNYIITIDRFIFILVSITDGKYFHLKSCF